MRTDVPVSVKLEEYKPYPFEIERVALKFTLDPDTTHVESHLLVKRTGPGDMVLDGEMLELKQIEIDRQTVPESAYTLTDTALTLHDVPETFALKINVEISPIKNTALSGLYISGERFCTQCEAVGFRRITFYPDRPDVMSRFHVTIEADHNTYPILLSNGTPGTVREGYAEWDDPHPKPAYLFALCAGDYDIYTDTFTTKSGKEIDLAIHVDKGDAPRAAWAMDSLKRSMKWDEDVYGREYDLGVFNIVAVRDFNFGAMENKGLNIFNSAYVLADEDTATDADFEAIESIVAHEYFHNWTGNRITCRDWFQLCLKEGLTVFRDQEFSADMRSRPVQRIKDVIRLRSRQFPEDAGPLAHPVRPSAYGAIDNLYTATVYEKGAELIRMLKTMIGDDAFYKGMDLYFDRHDGEAVTIEDFYACFEEVSGQDLSNFRRWYSQPGTPEIQIDEEWNERTSTLTLNIVQKDVKEPGREFTDPRPIPLHMRLLNRDGTPLDVPDVSPNGDVSVTLTTAVQSFEFKFPDGTDWPIVSTNRGFSAPINKIHSVDHKQGVDARTMAEIDDDAFNKWDGFQALFKDALCAAAYEGTACPDELISALASEVEKAAASDPAYAALLSRLPSVGELMLERNPANPSALAAARKSAKFQLANKLELFAHKTLAEPSPSPYNPGAQQAGIRALRCAAIDLLGALEDAARLLAIYQSAPNMTESLAALRALSELHGSPERDEALSDFYSKWSDNPLVLDKWFSAQAVSGNAKLVEELTQHPDFDLKNPNRVRAVIGAFAAQNLGEFHAPDGLGHALLADIITAADAINPALAARLASTFEQWNSLENNAKQNAQSTMRTLMEKSLSKNTGDILSRSLGLNA